MLRAENNTGKKYSHNSLVTFTQKQQQRKALEISTI